ncbi:MAG: choice-of-anchor tandem repeat GloVer-containing protein [Candidatus Korobacteraceae bacterium]
MEISQKNRKRLEGIAFLTKVALSATTFLLLVGAVSQAQTFTVLYHFTGNGSNGAPFQPYNGLALSPGGNLYGTTLKGGTYENGTAFELKHAGSAWLLNLLYNFQGGTDGASPIAGLAIASNGALYGTTPTGGGLPCGLAGGCGTVYSLRPPARAVASAQTPWTETVLYRFQGGTDGAAPQFGRLDIDSDGNLYGTTQYGGDVQDCGSAGCGTVYELLPLPGGGWLESVLHRFDGSNSEGSQPLGGIIHDQYNDLYGVTSAGKETFFDLQPGGGGYWTFYQVDQFTSNIGCDIDTSLLLDPNTFNFYGVAQGCGPSGSGAGGAVFVWFYGFDPGYNFGLTREPTTAPEGPLIEDSAGNLYGVSFNGGAHGQGAVYKLTPTRDGFSYSSLHDFTGGTDGAGPVGNLVMDADGNLYGVASGGGSQFAGVIFEITGN